ncbi:hypothetical protein [Salinisphaera sp. G21_0]|uniref:hypothetical protein n=1 Tax=Salinisphaera sp. G21_0 TaxID=2821094 RepID=UPI001ADD19F3|nr:hypothetical protein [Salinisphaera sp. G21_0]MBO9480599.1 hypothetical protein [Salinisphaera sp. G21_0]
MPPGIEGQRPVGGNTSSSEGGAVKPTEESSNATYRGTRVSKVSKVAKKSQVSQDDLSEKNDTLIENRDIKKQNSSTGTSGPYSSARMRRRAKQREAEEGMKKSLSASDSKHQDRKISQELPDVAEDSGISEDESIDSPPHSPKASNREREYDSGIEDDASSLTGRAIQAIEPGPKAETGAHAPDLQQERPLPARPESTSPLKKVSKKRKRQRQKTGIDKGGANQRSNSDPGVQTSRLPNHDELLAGCQRLAKSVKKLDEDKGRRESEHLEELDRLEAVYAENNYDDDRKIAHYLVSGKAAMGISKGKKRLQQELKEKPWKEGVESVKLGAGKIIQEMVDRAIHQKRPLHPVRRKQKSPETEPVKDVVMDSVMVKVEGDFNGTDELVKSLKSEVSLSTASQYAAAKKLFVEELERAQWAKEAMEETHALQKQIQTLKATLFEELSILGHNGSEPMVDPYINDSAYVSALEAAVETIGMGSSAAQEHLEKHPALQKHLEKVGYQEDRDSSEYLDKLDDMEHLNDREYLQTLKYLKDPQFVRGFRKELRLEWLAKHLSQTFRRYSNATIGHPNFKTNMKGLLDTLNAREQNVGNKLKNLAKHYEQQCKDLRDNRKHLNKVMEAYEENGSDGVDILKHRKVLARAEALKESMKPVHDQIKLVTSYEDPEMQCAYLQKQCNDLDKQHASVQKSIQECQKKLDKAESKNKGKSKNKSKPLEDVQNKMNDLKRESADIARQSDALKQEYMDFNKALNMYYKIQFDMDIKLVNQYSDPKRQCADMKVQYTAMDKQHASVQKSIKKCQEKLDKATSKGGDLEGIQNEMDNFEIQSAELESQSADLKSKHAALGQALKRLDTIQLGFNNEKQSGNDGDE